MEPGPIPTLTISTPTSKRARAPSAVATFPATITTSLKVWRISEILLITPAECPCAVSITIASTPASINFSTRTKVSFVIPTAAAASSLPCLSLAEFGNSITFSISLIVISLLECLLRQQVAISRCGVFAESAQLVLA